MRLHDLRYSFASVGAANGDSLLIIGKLLGHKNAASTQRYAHLGDDPLRFAAVRISQRAFDCSYLSFKCFLAILVNHKQ